MERHNIADDRFAIIGVGEYVDKAVIESAYRHRQWTAGLAVFPPSEDHKIKLLTKFYEYMQHGIPIIASDFPLWKQFLIENHCGIVLDIETREFTIDFDQLSTLTENGIQSTFDWQSEEAKLLELYAKIG